MQVLVDNLVVSYQDTGDGPVLVLLHGWGQSLATFNDLTGRLATSYRVIRLDLPGFGGTAQPAVTWGIGDYAEFVKAFLIKLNVTEPYAILGHSFGGRVAIKGVGMGLLNPQKVVLVDAAGVRHSASLRNRSYAVVAKVGKFFLSVPGLSRLRQALRRKLYHRAGATDYLEAGNMQQIFLRAINEDLLEHAASITVPTLLIWGDEDFDTPISDAAQMQQSIEGSELIVLKRAGHFSYADQPVKFIDALKGFL